MTVNFDIPLTIWTLYSVEYFFKAASNWSNESNVVLTASAQLPVAGTDEGSLHSMVVFDWQFSVKAVPCSTKISQSKKNSWHIYAPWHTGQNIKFEW